MTGRCRDVESSVGRPLHALSEAERLVLEQHLATCSACRTTSELSRTITELVTSAPSALSPLARERAIASAFERGASVGPRVTTLRGALQLGASVAAAALLLLGLRFALLEQKSRAPFAESAPAQPERSRAPEPTQALAVAPTRESAAQAVTSAASDAWIDLVAAETRPFAHAQVALSAGSRVRFSVEQSALELARGEATIDVDASRHQPFAVVTQNFRVQVLGTQFVVTPERVEVLRGRVQVLAHDGHPLTRKLKAGQSYRYRAPAEPATRPQAATKPQAAERESAVQLLERARALVAGGQLASARETIELAEQRASSSEQRAEAGTLRAECALLERNPAAAIDAYLAVADRYVALPAAQNALFAAAQLKERARDRVGARALFERYLARYPHGRFADEARSRLDEIAR